jgi:peroxiredoxin
VAVLGVNVKDAPSNAEAFTTELGITYDLAVDPDGDLFTAVEGFAMPTTLFVDAEGTIVYRHAGFLDGQKLADLAVQHLGIDANDG